MSLSFSETWLQPWLKPGMGWCDEMRYIWSIWYSDQFLRKNLSKNIYVNFPFNLKIMYATPNNEPLEKSKEEFTNKGWLPNIRRAKEHRNQHLFNSVLIVIIFRWGQNTFGLPFIFKFMRLEVNLIHLFLNYFLKPPTFCFTRIDVQESYDIPTSCQTC